MIIALDMLIFKVFEVIGVGPAAGSTRTHGGAPALGRRPSPSGGGRGRLGRAQDASPTPKTTLSSSYTGQKRHTRRRRGRKAREPRDLDRGQPSCLGRHPKGAARDRRRAHGRS